MYFPRNLNLESVCSLRQVCELGQQLEEERSCIEDLVRRDRQEVSQYFETLEATLARKKRAYLDAVDEAAADVSQAFDPLVDRVQELQVCVCVNLKWYIMIQECWDFVVKEVLRPFCRFNTTNRKCSGALAAAIKAT